MARSIHGSALARNHVRFGWLALAAFATVGAALEALHGFKASWYLEEAYGTRRLLFTLGHAHGALLAVVNVVFGLAVAALDGRPGRLALASRLLTVATVLLPAGFLIGGFGIRGTDPGIGIYLVPVGAACAVAAFVAAGTGLGSLGGAARSAPVGKQDPRRATRRKGQGGRRRRR